MYRRLSWKKRGTEIAEDYIFFNRKGNENYQLGQDFLHHRIVSAIKRVDFFSDKVSYVVLRGGWFNIIVCNVHAPSEEKSEDLKTVL